MTQRREGFYENEDEARAHIEQIYEYHPHLRGLPLVMNYHFGSIGRPNLEQLILDLADDDFAQCDVYFIDQDEYAGPGEPDHWWVGSKLAAYTPASLIAEVNKYASISANHGVIFRGITADAHQEE